MLGWKSGQCEAKMAVISQFTYYWTESYMIRRKAAMGIYSHSYSSTPIPILLFLLPFSFLLSLPHSHWNPMGPMRFQLFLFPCTSQVPVRPADRSIRGHWLNYCALSTDWLICALIDSGIRRRQPDNDASYTDIEQDTSVLLASVL